MSQKAIPFLFMRGGTSRGPYLNAADLPEDRDTLTEILIAIIGSDHPLNIDGVPGTSAPIELKFMDVTGALFLTGSRKDVVDGIEFSCMDVAMPMVIAHGGFWPDRPRDGCRTRCRQGLPRTDVSGPAKSGVVHGYG